MMSYHLSLQKFPGCFLDYICHCWNAAASGVEANGQPTLHPRESFGQKPAFMRSVSETSEPIRGHNSLACSKLHWTQLTHIKNTKKKKTQTNKNQSKQTNKSKQIKQNKTSPAYFFIIVLQKH